MENIIKGSGTWLKVICLFALEGEALFCVDKSRLERQPSRCKFFRQVLFFLASKYLNMDSGGVEAQALEFQRIDEVLEDRDSRIFDTILSFGPISQLKMRFKDQGTDLHNFFQSYLYYFCPNKTLNFLDFIDWCTSNYSSSERVILDAAKSKIICLVNPLVIRYSLSVPHTITQNHEGFYEEDLIQFFTNDIIEQKQPFFLKCFR